MHEETIENFFYYLKTHYVRDKSYAIKAARQKFHDKSSLNTSKSEYLSWPRRAVGNFYRPKAFYHFIKYNNDII